ncbi:hypothetical protein ACRE_006200 [Hapsidospora chrysogenum ATCC 11550]|uniref:Zn(2)-C6 fungal-type domain-containing protein n=1 Tax=Hapsidospora chrysogenum (strain ATCC 11550 / CBS 779.69 / DSM 880 / IAM 14645 / JCM 23072 / IMI 49137) TaxID=857340 RepID=A0A086TGH9_HAPC1|nr:hypothetical protein ACRE_006200 [Hapsidospora chrysogenum ATCC 11550]
MFGTWKYDPETDEVQSLRQAFDPVTARSSQHQACNRCHEKKLRCSGDKEGCDRCVASQLHCEYTRSSSRGSRRGGKTGRRSAGSTSPGESPVKSPVRTSRTTSHSRKVPASPLSSTQRGESYFPVSTPSTAVPTTAGDDLIDSIDFSMLSPSDAFDFDSLNDPAPYTSSPVARATTAVAPSAHLALAPYTSSSSSPYHGSAHQYPNNVDDGQWASSFQAQGGFYPDDHSSRAVHQNMEIADQGNVEPYGDNDHYDHRYYQQHHAQGYYDPQYWGGRGGGG